MDTNKVKTKKKNTSVYVTIVIVLAILAVITAIFGSASRNRDDRIPDSGPENVTAQGDILTSPPTEKVETEAPAVATDPETSKTADADAETGDDVPVDAEPEEKLPSFVAPVGGVLITGHSESVPVFSNTMNDYRTHSGVDISVGVGEEIKAAADGVVGTVWNDPMMGSCITIVHEGGAVSTYKNLNPEIPDSIAAGVSVKAGQVIASAGESALQEIAEECHLHYELAINGASVNPAEYINFAENESDFTE